MVVGYFKTAAAPMESELEFLKTVNNQSGIYKYL